MAPAATVEKTTTSATNDNIDKQETAVLSLADDLTELRVMVRDTYKELQLQAVQQQQQAGTASNAQLQMAAAAFQLAMGAALKRLNELAAASPKEWQDDPEALSALASLSWHLLRVAPFLPTPN